LNRVKCAELIVSELIGTDDSLIDRRVYDIKRVTTLTIGLGLLGVMKTNKLSLSGHVHTK